MFLLDHHLRGSLDRAVVFQHNYSVSLSVHIFHVHDQHNVSYDVPIQISFVLLHILPDGFK